MFVPSLLKLDDIEKSGEKREYVKNLIKTNGTMVNQAGTTSTEGLNSRKVQAVLQLVLNVDHTEPSYGSAEPH